VPVDKWNFLNSNFIESDHKSQEQKYDKYDKYNGKYNAKLKKYKAYEKFVKPQEVSVIDFGLVGGLKEGRKVRDLKKGSFFRAGKILDDWEA
jgi:hypothetical protein